MMDLYVRAARRADILTEVARNAVSFIWRCSDFDREELALQVTRLSMEAPPQQGGRGPGGALMHQGGGCHLPGFVNLLRKGTCPDFVDFMLRHGVVNRIELVGNGTELRDACQRHGVRLYGTDDYGPELNRVSVNCREAFRLIDTKSRIGDYLPAEFAPTQVTLSLLRPFDASVLRHLSLDGEVDVFVKGDNAEHGNTGVWRVKKGPIPQMLERANALREEMLARAKRMNTLIDRRAAELRRPLLRLSENVVLQRELPTSGVNCGFTVFLCSDRKTVLVTSVTEQVTDPTNDHKVFSINAPVVERTIRPIEKLIRGLVSGVWTHHPSAFGFLKCDFWDDGQGNLTAFDLGLRPAGNTPTAMARMRIEECAGFTPQMHSDYIVSTARANMPFGAWEKALGDLMVPDNVYRTGYGVLPRGYNPIQGQARLILSAPTADEMPLLQAELLRRLELAFGRVVKVKG